jgi:transposase
MNEQANRSESTSQRPREEKAEPLKRPGEGDPGCCSAETSTAETNPRRLGQPRLRTADRQQILPPMPLEDVIELDHPARSVWRFVEGLDLSLLYDRIRSREHTPGRPPTDPRILVALWLYAILYDVISARRVEKLSRRHNAFRWLRGGVPLNHHLLSDFLVEDMDFLKQLFTHSVAVLQQEDLVDLDRIGQDGMRVRASAGAASFRRRATLEKLLQQAEQKVQKLAAQVAQTVEPGPSEVTAGEDVAAEKTVSASEADKPTAGQAAAQQRAAEERLERVQQALERMPEMEARKEKAGEDKNKARVSTTDPEATVMKMADGGYRPAYNFEFGTTCNHLVVVGVDVVTTGSDQGQLPPMLDQIEKRCGKRPKQALVDGGFASHEDIEAVQSGVGGKAACKVYAPVPKPKKAGVDRHAPHAGDSPEVAEWRQRMGTADAKEIYKQRAATAECVNAQARNRGLIRLLVRGLEKVKAIALWFATVHNMARGFALLPQQAATERGRLPVSCS